jgi:CO/xanthine dehydrogenase FAD-binding subunit
MSHTAEVLIPASVGEAVSASGDGYGVTVIGGGTIVMPELASRRTSVSKALILSRAGLASIVRDGGTVKIGAATPLEALVGATPDPLSTAAQRVGDYEIRGHRAGGRANRDRIVSSRESFDMEGDL